MSPRDDDRRLADVDAAITAIERHLKRGAIDDELIFDACRARLIEIGEAVKAIDPELLARVPARPRCGRPAIAGEFRSRADLSHQ